MPTRREFLKGAAALAALVSVGIPIASAAPIAQKGITEYGSYCCISEMGISEMGKTHSVVPFSIETVKSQLREEILLGVKNAGARAVLGSFKYFVTAASIVRPYMTVGAKCLATGGYQAAAG